MEHEAGDILLILGGTALVVYYGVRARKERQRQERRPAPGTAARRHHIRRAFEAEFGLMPGEWEDGERGELPGGGAEDPFGVVVCPQCGERYRAGGPVWEGCGPATVDEVEAPDPRSGHDRLRAPLVCVLTTTDGVEAAVVRSLLECHDIPTTSTGPVALNVHLFHGIEAATIKLMVLEPDAERARQIIAAAR